MGSVQPLLSKSNDPPSIVFIVFSLGGLPSRIVNIKFVKPRHGTTMETLGKPEI